MYAFAAFVEKPNFSNKLIISISVDAIILIIEYVFVISLRRSLEYT